VLGEDRAGYVIVEQVNDLDDIVICVKNRQFSVRLAGVVPFSHWPVNGDSKRISGLREEAYEAVKKLLVGNEFFATIKTSSSSDSTIAVELAWTGKHVTPEKPWKGQRPSEQLGWGMTSINILMVEKGYTLSSTADEPVERLRRLFKEAEQLAAKNQTGIWVFPGFAGKLKERVDIQCKATGATCRR
jgi:hypothetical protein